MIQSYKKTIFAFSLISITAVAVVLVCIQMVNITSILAKDRRTASADAMMDEVREKLRAGMQEQVNRTGAGIYDEMIREYGGGPERTLGQGYKGEYCERCVKRLNEEFGDSAVLVSVLRGFLPETEGARFMLSEAPLPSFSLDYDQSLGEIKGCRVSDIIVGYMKDGSNEGQKVFDLSIDPPPADFADAPVSINDFCMLGMKGIYISGETSAIVGDIYAGTHTYEEGREEETDYGEMDPYGGINILNTSLSVSGNIIITEGDINIKGSYVSLGKDNATASVFAKALNDIDSFPQVTEYSVNGQLFLRDGSNVYTNENRYEEIMALMNETFGRISVIDSRYDSNGPADSDAKDNDGEERLRKIIADDDVTIDEDYTGAVITTGNIYVEEGISVEGLLIAGDRIYVRGNNSIVSGPDVINAILRSEEEQLSDGSLPDGGYIGDYIKKLM